MYKECPFCSSTDLEFIVGSCEDSTDLDLCIYCNNCKMNGPVITIPEKTYYSSNNNEYFCQKVEELWNTRTTDEEITTLTNKLNTIKKMNIVNFQTFLVDTIYTMTEMTLGEKLERAPAIYCDFCSEKFYTPEEAAAHAAVCEHHPAVIELNKYKKEHNI